MTTTRTTLDIDKFRSALESWDLDALSALYADDVEFRQIDHATPPKAPHLINGRDELIAMFRDVASRGITSQVVDVIDAGERVAVAVACRYPTGECVHDHTFLDVRDGLIVRHAGVSAWDS